MDLHKLRVFREVADQEGFTAAAEALLISQPLVSAHIKDLEQFYGAQLFDRSHRKARLTEAGQILHRYAKQILNTWQEAREALDDYKGLMQGELVVAASTTPGSYLLPDLLGVFHRQFPAIKLQLLIQDSRRVQEWVVEGTVELGVIGQEPDHPNLVCEAFAEDELVAVAALEHPLSLQSEVELAELMDAEHICREAGSGTRATAEAAVQGVNHHLRPSMELGSITALKRAVAAGLGVTIISRYAVEEELAQGRLKLLPVIDFRPRRAFQIIFRQGQWMSPSSRCMLEMLRQYRKEKQLMPSHLSS